MNRLVHASVELTRNQSLVLAALTTSEGPLSAYAILNQLRADGFRAPLQVYRALNRLKALGLVHRVESLNAFVACSHHSCGGTGRPAFMICRSCGQVGETSDTRLVERLRFLAGKAGFTVKKSTIELRGLCRSCQAA